MEGVLDFELGLEERSASASGGCGDREGRELWDICEDDLEAAKDEREARLVLKVVEWFPAAANDAFVFARVSKGVVVAVDAILVVCPAPGPGHLKPV